MRGYSSQHEGGGPRCELVPSHDAFPILGKVAQVYNSFGSSVYGLPVERIFSTAGLSSNGKRSVIGPENLNCALCIHDNLSLVTFIFTLLICLQFRFAFSKYYCNLMVRGFSCFKFIFTLSTQTLDTKYALLPRPAMHKHSAAVVRCLYVCSAVCHVRVLCQN